MEQKFLSAWLSCREQAAALGVRLRPITGDAMSVAHRSLSSNRPSDGFDALADLGRLDLSLEYLAVDRRYTSLFTDEEANRALARLLEAGCHF